MGHREVLEEILRDEKGVREYRRYALKYALSIIDRVEVLERELSELKAQKGNLNGTASPLKHESNGR